MEGKLLGMRITQIASILMILVSFTSCKIYKQDILFKLDDNFTADDLSAQIYALDRNYIIQINDFLEMNVFTNKGEQIIDPNNELLSGNQNRNIQNQQAQNQNLNRYLVQQSGLVKLPVIGEIELAGLTLLDAEAKLQQLYDEYYKDSFVRLVYSNKRVFMLGANGGAVIQIQNENTSLVEVLAIYGGFDIGAKANSIKVIRGDLTNPEVFLVDLTTISGMRASVVTVQPGDIIYVEPWRRTFYEALRDAGPIFSFISSMIALTVIFAK